MSFFIALGKKAGFHKDPLRWNRVSSWWVISMFLPQENYKKILFIYLFIFLKGKVGDLLGATFRLCAYWSYILCNWANWSSKLSLVGLPCKFCPLQLVTSGSFCRDSGKSGLPDVHHMVSPRSPIRECIMLRLIPEANEWRTHKAEITTTVPLTHYDISGPNTTSEGK